MTALFLRKPLSQELTELIFRLGDKQVRDEGLTPEETRDLREWLQAARALHYAELRDARGARWEAAILAFGKRAGASEPQRSLPREEAVSEAFRKFAEAMTQPCDTEPAA